MQSYDIMKYKNISNMPFCHKKFVVVLIMPQEWHFYFHYEAINIRFRYILKVHKTPLKAREYFRE